MSFPLALDHQPLLPLKAISTQKMRNSSTFINNMKLPVHRWFRFSAGFSAQWVEETLREKIKTNDFYVLDPFAGSGTTLLSADCAKVHSYGIESHPFIYRIANAKLLYASDTEDYLELIKKIIRDSKALKGKTNSYPSLIKKCYDEKSLSELDSLKRAYLKNSNNSDASELAWLTLVSILRVVSHAGTAPWQYVLPNKKKKNVIPPNVAFESMSKVFMQDMLYFCNKAKKLSNVINSDARTCKGIPPNSIDFVITSPPYANNYDYADATRLEMSFMGDVNGWSELQDKVRKYLIRSCSQHVPEASLNLDEILEDSYLKPIYKEISAVCKQLSEIRKTKGGRKTYHLMIACYFLDLARVWNSLRKVCKKDSDVCFVIGDSAPYGVYVPVINWLGELALSAGFKNFTFNKTRDRNIKWKNRKHRVPLCEGQLWLKG